MQSSGAARPWIAPPPAVEPLALRRVPVLAAALCFAAGDAMARQWHAPALLAAETAALVLLTCVSLRRAPRVAWMPALALWAALGCWCAQMQPPPANPAALAPYADGLSRTFRAEVERVRTLPATPAELQPDAGGAALEEGDEAWEPPAGVPVQSINLKVLAAEEVTPDSSTMRAVQGGVRLTVNGPALHALCGQVIEAPLRLREPETYRVPGAFAYAEALRAEGIGYLAGTESGRVSVVGSVRAAWRCRLYAAQSWASGRMQAFGTSHANRLLPAALRLRPQDVSLLDAMLFGDRAALTHGQRVGFERTGTFHLFVVSGVHVALLGTAIFWLARRLRLRMGVAIPLTLALLLGYALLTGFGVPAQRALWMTACVLLARGLRRRAVALNALGFAAVVVMALDPRALFESGFQMTFLVLVAVAGLAAPLHARLFSRFARSLTRLDETRLDAFLPAREAERRVRLRMACSIAAALHPRLRAAPAWTLRGLVGLLEFVLFALVTEACMVLPMAQYFHRATLLALPANLFVVPLAGVLLTAGFVLFLALLAGQWVALVPAALTAALLHLVTFALGRLNRLALADLRVPGAPWPAVVACCVLLALACWLVRLRPAKAALAGALCVLLTPLLALWPSPPRMNRGLLEVTAIDVGQGDSLLLVTPDGHTLLIDAGGPSGFAAVVQAKQRSSERWNIGEDVVAPYLWSRGIRRLDAVAITHAHSDHIDGMAAVLRAFRPRELWLSAEPNGSAPLQAILREAAAQGTAVKRLRAPTEIAWHGVQVGVLAPEAEYDPAESATNDDSLVLRVAYGSASVLLEGDAESASEQTMLAHQRVQPTTLLKVGHHGSRTSTTQGFLDAASPRDAVISVGKGNTFGHPRRDVLIELEAARVHTFRTDRAGTETFLLSADGRIEARSAASH